MATRRKGEQPVPKAVTEWSPDHPVADAMRSGSGWFEAWVGQMTTPYERLAQATGLSVDRIREIATGGPIMQAELEAFAKAWWITPDGLLASMPDPERMIG